MNENNEEQKPTDFDIKAKLFQDELKRISEVYGVMLVTSIYFKEEKLQGVHAYGTSSIVEEMGLVKLIENKFSR